VYHEYSLIHKQVKVSQTLV